MKILFIADNFPPETNAPASRTFEHAQRWVRSGAEVTVITCTPNFPQGRVHDGYRNAWRTVESMDGIRVVRVKTLISSNEGFGIRVLDYISFMFSALFFGLFETRPHVVVGTSPQFFAAVGAWLLSLVKWRPFVFELRDLWPASIVTVGAMRKGVAVRALEKLELFLYRRSRLIVSVTESFKHDLIDRGIDAAKIGVVRNGVDLGRFRPRPRSDEVARSLDVDNKLVVAYFGTHGMAHALENVLEAAALLEENPRTVFLLVGDGARKRALVEQARRMRLENVIFRDPVAKKEMPLLWSVCDIALVHLKDDPVFATVIPSKLFEAFGMGKPVLVVQPDGEAAGIVRAENAGIWVPPESPKDLAETLVRLNQDPDLLSEYATNSARAASRHSRDELAKSMLQMLQSCIEYS